MDPSALVIEAARKALDKAIDAASKVKDNRLLKDLADVQRAVIKLEREIADRDTQIVALGKEIENFRAIGELTLKEDAYWAPDGSGPFCPKCAQDDLPRKRQMVAGSSDYWSCPNCTTVAERPEARARRAQAGRPPGGGWMTS